MSCVEYSGEVLTLREARGAICYPRPSSERCKRVLEELEALGIDGYAPIGSFRKPGLPLLGSGWAGNVFAATAGGMLVAVKVLRPDSRRVTMLRECLLASIAGAYGIGPRVYKCSLHAIVYELLPGPRLSAYRPASRLEARLVIKRLVYKAYLLDKLGIDHGELVRPGGQVLLGCDHDPYIIDYDSASATRKPRNVTSLAAGPQRLPWARQLVRPSSDPALREALRRYRLHPSLENLEAVLSLLLHPG